MEGLARLRPAFAEMGAATLEDDGRTFDDMCLERYPEIDRVEHVHHAGNSSGVVDGAAAALVASDGWVRAHGVTPRARIRATAAVGSEPVIMLTAPGPAAERCLAKAGMRTGDIDLWEINEAFAAVPLKTMRDLRTRPRPRQRQRGRDRAGSPDRGHRRHADRDRAWTSSSAVTSPPVS